jgi:predicted 3-demethylubiquinone-9 3-methyltransferase (glyoxalase superfamily)
MGDGGAVVVASFRIGGLEISLLNGGPTYSITPAVSFFVRCRDAEQVDTLWAALSEGGTALMPLDKYPFSEKFGWVQDKYGVSWQLSLGDGAQSVTPFLMFVGDNFRRAEEAMALYTSVFDGSRIDQIERYGLGMHEPEGAVMFASFTLAGQPFHALESGLDHAFTFTEGTSFSIGCGDQEEVDYFWNALTADGGEESMCGWLKDKFGLSWQVIPRVLPELLGDPDPEKAGRAMQAMLQMRKIDIAELQRASAGEQATPG